jgi:hypothetical protein
MPREMKFLLTQSLRRSWIETAWFVVRSTRQAGLPDSVWSCGDRDGRGFTWGLNWFKCGKPHKGDKFDDRNRAWDHQAILSILRWTPSLAKSVPIGSHWYISCSSACACHCLRRSNSIHTLTG